MSISQDDQGDHGYGAGILAPGQVKQEELWENWSPEAAMEWRNNDDVAQINKNDLHLHVSPFELGDSPLWDDERPLLNVQGRHESWDEEPVGVAVDISEDHATQFEKRTMDFIAGDILSGLNASPAEAASDPPQPAQALEVLSTNIVEQLSQVQSVPSPHVVRLSDSPRSSRRKRAGNGPRTPASDAAHIAALESDAAKLAEKNRKSRERSLRTRTRNAERMNEIERGVRRLKLENTGIKSILDGSHGDLESLLLAVLPTCVQQFENELARVDSPGVRRCAAYLVATVKRLSRNRDRTSSYTNQPHENVHSRATSDMATLRSIDAICNSKEKAREAAFVLGDTGFPSQGPRHTSSDMAANVLHSGKLVSR